MPLKGKGPFAVLFAKVDVGDAANRWVRLAKVLQGVAIVGRHHEAVLADTKLREGREHPLGKVRIKGLEVNPELRDRLDDFQRLRERYGALPGGLPAQKIGVPPYLGPVVFAYLRVPAHRALESGVVGKDDHAVPGRMHVELQHLAAALHRIAVSGHRMFRRVGIVAAVRDAFDAAGGGTGAKDAERGAKGMQTGHVHRFIYRTTSTKGLMRLRTTASQPMFQLSDSES